MKEPQPLDFEKPIVELQRRLQEIRDHSDEHALDFDAEVEAMEAKIETTRREIYGNLSAWQRVQIARHTQRPFALDYVERCFTNWNELHGDRLFGDDKAMPMRDRDAGGATLHRDHESKGPQYQGKCDAQFRVRASGRLSQGAALDAARREI